MSSYKTAREYVEHLRANDTKKRVVLDTLTISEEDAAAIGEAIAANGRSSEPSMEMLEMCEVGIRRGAASLIWRAAGVSSARTLFAEYTPLFEEGATAFAEGLASNTSLTRVELSYCQYSGAEGGAAIGRALGTNSALLELYLLQQRISNQGATGFAEGLATNKTLESLTLRSCRIGTSGARALGGALAAISALAVLSLNQNPLKDAGVVGVADGLAENRSLKTLELCYCDIGAEGCEAIGRALQANTTLKGLDISYNWIDDDCAFALARGLRANGALNRLIFSDRRPFSPSSPCDGYQTISMAGAAALGLAIRDSPRDAALTLEGVRLCEAWELLGLANDANERPNEEIIRFWMEERRRGVTLVVAFGMVLVPRLGGASVFHGLDPDVFRVVGCSVL